MGKRPSFIEVATSRLSFLVDDHGFAGPEIERPWDRIPAITRVCYHRCDMAVEVAHVVGFMGENYVETLFQRKDGESLGDWMALGSNATHTGYQLRRALNLQAQAIRSQLGPSLNPPGELGLVPVMSLPARAGSARTDRGARLAWRGM